MFEHKWRFENNYEQTRRYCQYCGEYQHNGNRHARCPLAKEEIEREKRIMQREEKLEYKKYLEEQDRIKYLESKYVRVNGEIIDR